MHDGNDELLYYHGPSRKYHAISIAGKLMPTP